MYQETDYVPDLVTTSWKPHSVHPANLQIRILELYERYERGSTAAMLVLHFRGGITVDHNTVHAILQAYDLVTEDPNKLGRIRP